MYSSEEEKKKMEEHLSQCTGGNVKLVEPDDTFDFKCQRCGQCCMGRNDIVLSPFDIYNGSVAVGITPQEFIDRYTNLTIGQNSKLPVLTLKSNNKNWCHFLEFDIKNGGLFKCSINDHKPGACRNHPIGIVTSFKKDGDIDSDVSEMYIKVEQCSNSQGHNNPIKVSDWMQGATDCSEERLWSHKLQSVPSMVLDISKFFKLLAATARGPKDMDSFSVEDQERVKDTMNKSGMIVRILFASIVELTYGKYDITRPFVEQAKENYDTLHKLCTEISGFKDAMVKSFLDTDGDIEDLENSKE